MTVWAMPSRRAQLRCRKPKGCLLPNICIAWPVSTPAIITITALGPLTILAQAVTQFPDIAELVAEVGVMGGTFGFNGETANMTPVAEANFYNDPHAADIVVRNHWPLTIVGLDVTHQTLITPQDLEELRKKSERYGSFIHGISQIYMSLYQDKFGMPGFSIHDPSAVIYASNPDFFDVKGGRLEVVPKGNSKGQSILVSAEGTFRADGRVHNV